MPRAKLSPETVSATSKPFNVQDFSYLFATICGYLQFKKITQIQKLDFTFFFSKKGPSNREDINELVVMATLNASEGSTFLQKFFGALDCPCMCPTTFNTIMSHNVGPKVERLCEESMMNATRYEVYCTTDERNPAGVQELEVAIDGFYSKRSQHERNYTSLSGGKWVVFNSNSN